MTHLADHNKQMKAIPKEKWAAKVQRTLWGLFFIAMAVAIEVWRPEWPDLLSIILGVVGGVTAAGDIVLDPVRRLVAIAKDAKDKLLK